MNIIARTILSCNVLAWFSQQTPLVCAAMAVNPEGLQEQRAPLQVEGGAENKIKHTLN